MKLLSPGDGEGFVAAFVNNLVQLLILAPLCIGVLGFSPALVYGRILPGVAVSFLVGNLFYAWQALALARREGRDDVCALPYGISTPGLFAHVFLVMLPARQLALARGIPDPGTVRVARGAGGVFPGRVAGVRLRVLRREHPAAHAAGGDARDPRRGGAGFSRAGVSVPDFRLARGRVGHARAGVHRVLRPGAVSRRPAGDARRAGGRARRWRGSPGWRRSAARMPRPLAHLRLYLPWPVPGELLAALGGGHIVAYLSVVIPIGLLGVLASLQNIESASAAGDEYPGAPEPGRQRVGHARGGAVRFAVSRPPSTSAIRPGRNSARGRVIRCSTAWRSPSSA